MEGAEGWLQSLGEPRAHSAGREDPVTTPAAWLKRARRGGRSGRSLGEARPGRWTYYAHPLLCHMVDVAAVAARFLTGTAPPALRRRLLSMEPGRGIEALKSLLFAESRCTTSGQGRARLSSEGRLGPRGPCRPPASTSARTSKPDTTGTSGCV